MVQAEVQQTESDTSSLHEDPVQLKCAKCHRKSPVTGTTRVVRKAGKEILTPWSTLGRFLFQGFILLAVVVYGLPLVSEFGVIAGAVLGAIVALFLVTLIQIPVTYYRAPHFEVRFFRCDKCGSLLKTKHLRRVGGDPA
jgi:hypothetical protein